MKKYFYIISICSMFALVGILISNFSRLLFDIYVIAFLSIVEIILRRLAKNNNSKIALEFIWFFYNYLISYLIFKNIFEFGSASLPAALGVSAIIAIFICIHKRRLPNSGGESGDSKLN